MCGIFAVTSEGGRAAAPDPAAFSDGIERLGRLDPWTVDPDQADGLMEGLREQCGLWLRPEGALEVAQPETARLLDNALKRFEAWLEGLSGRIAGPNGLSQKTLEGVHRLLTEGRDTVWQLRVDVLGNVPKFRALLGEAKDADRRTLHHAWSLNLILNNIDRLEVRGRDSAGVAAYVRFPSAADLDAFLDAGRREGFDKRSATRAFAHLGVVRPKTAPDTLLFAFKVADEVGEMGQNVRFLREAIVGDSLFQAALRAPETALHALGHTRWASNGVISVPNCHPVDSAVLKAGAVAPGSPGSIVAALNGDIDNFQELIQKYVVSRDASVEPGITTDAKIIPLVVSAHLESSGSLEEAFAKAFEEFEGSMAVCLMAADRPGELICAQKGSGQGLFIGFAGDTVAVASEMYGLVELTPRYLKAAGEREEGGRTVGETFLVRPPGAGGVSALPGGDPVEESRIKTAEITTRDINRGDYPRFLLKEISESVRSVEKTIEGKVSLDAKTRKARTLLDETVIPAGLTERLKSGGIRRIIPIGQGTAAIAAEGIGHLLESSLEGASIEITPMKATELSSHHLAADMKDCLIVAVSQSGTTTDTNRTVDLARERGAVVIAVVNRRNSDLVYKADGVLYTSDGRDIEMSVASTKAFYAQNVAGEILALALGEALGRLDAETLLRRVEDLLELPAAMRRTLELSPLIQKVAVETALHRRYWALVGSGPTKIAADEVRIKLSELCYKAIAVDYLEDKKHIDLSSEPLIIVCASGLPEVAISDIVKEVAIFKAHDSVPVVMADEREMRFNPYAAHVIPIPAYEGVLGYLLPTMVGHLFGYHAARAFDRQADRLKKLRFALVREMERNGADLAGTDIWRIMGRAGEVASGALDVQSAMDSGAMDSGLEVRTATRLSALLDFLLGRIPLDMFFPRFQRPGTVGNLLAGAVSQLSEAINELCRPIDAIKHQAKTVTVGVSRQAERPAEGSLWSVFKEAEIDPVRVTASHANILSSLEPLVAGVSGATVYRVEGLSPIGKPRYSSQIEVLRKLKGAADIPSRCDGPRRLAGTKWGVVADGRVFLGRGQTDKRRILILPVIGQRPEGFLLLFHLDLTEKGPREQRMAALRSLQDRYKQVLIAVTEATNREWDPSMVDKLTNDQLFFDDPRMLGAMLSSQED